MRSLAILAVASFALPAVAQSSGERVGNWTVAKIAESEGGNVCSAVRLYGGGYGLEIVQARGLPRQRIVRLESPTIRPRQLDANSALFVSIGEFGDPRGDAVLRTGPRGLGYVIVLREASANANASDIRQLRSSRSINAFIGSSDTGTELQHIGTYDMEGGVAALDALARCVEGRTATSPTMTAPAPRPAPTRVPIKQPGPTPVAGGLPVPLGRYADGGKCASAHMLLTPKYWGDDADGEGWAIGPFRNLGANRWALSPSVTITVTGPRSFVFKGRTFTWCGA